MKNNPLIITCALTGAELSKKKTPHLPVTPDEIAAAAEAAVLKGASVIHLHVRDKNGNPSQDPEIFKHVTKKILEECDVIIQYSTGGAVGTPLKERIAPLRLKPEMASLSMGTMNFGDGIFENKESTIKKISEEMAKYKIIPELEIFDYGMLDTFQRLLEKGIIPPQFHINFVLGVPGGMSGDPKNLVTLCDRLLENQTFTVSGMGKYQLPLSIQSMVMGGHVRVGFEDNIYYRKGQLATSNAQFVERIVRIAKELDRPVATVDQARKMLKSNNYVKQQPQKPQKGKIVIKM